MTAVSIRALAIALAAAAGLAGCIAARSQYAPYAGYRPPPPSQPLRPQYPINPSAAQARTEATAPPPAAAAPDPDGAAPKAAPAAHVDAQSLPPVGDSSGAQRSPTLYDGEPMALTPLVWSPQSDQGQWIDVARHRRLRAEERPTTSRRGRHARHEGVEHATGVVEPSHASHTVVVHRGDTIDSIADALGATPEAIIKANHLRHPRALEVGQKLKVPTPKTYVVRPGDTLYSIHRRFDVPVDALKTLNGLGASAKLQPGQKIDLPGAAPEAAPAEEAPNRAERRARVQPPSRTEGVSGSAFGAPPPPPAAAAAPPGAPSQPIPYSSLPGHAPPPPTYPPAAVPAPPPGQPAPAPPAVAAGPTDAEVAAAGKGRFLWPTQGAVLSGFGPKPGGQRNDGVDIAAPEGSPVRAAATGDVVYAGNLVPGFGILVLIKHEDGWVTAYAHLSKTEVKIRDHVTQGTEIGQVGSTGGVDQPQLHFEVRYAASPLERARPIDPTLVLPSLAAPASGAPAPAGPAPLAQ
jgi:murein DD-endopeptidase MepM/ murein hydrolase activator NlpD